MNAGQSNINYAVPGFQYAYKVSVGTTTGSLASNDNYMLLKQSIEAYNIADLQWGTSNAQAAMVSFWWYSTIAQTYYLDIQNATRSYVTPFIATAPFAWQYVTVPIPGDTGGFWNTSNVLGANVSIYTGVGSNYCTATSNVWQSGTYYGINLNTSLLLNTPNSYVMCTGLQFEKGTIATPFEYRPYAIEYQLAQRYFEIVTGDMPSTGVYVNANNATYHSRMPLATIKRTPPTATIYSGYYLANNGSNAGTPFFLSFNSTLSTITPYAAGNNYNGVYYFNIAIWVNAEL